MLEKLLIKPSTKAKCWEKPPTNTDTKGVKVSSLGVKKSKKVRVFQKVFLEFFRSILIKKNYDYI